MTPLFFCLVAAASLGCIAALVRIIDDRVDASIREHVTAALEPSEDEVGFEAHVKQALDIATSLPAQRRAADDLSDIR